MGELTVVNLNVLKYRQMSTNSYNFVTKFGTMTVNVLRSIGRAGGLIYQLTRLSVRLTLSVIGAGFRLVVPRSKRSLIGETVLITGAGHGIGRELAVKLAKMGCIVVCWDADRDRNSATRCAVLNEGGEVYDFVVDVSSRLEVREAARLMRKYRIPDVTILINNAGVLMHKSFLDHDPDDVVGTFGVNVFSQFWTVETFLPRMLQTGRGHVVSICSLCGLYGVAQKVTYCASKFAGRGLMTGLREEYRMQPSIKFTTIYPFYVGTGLARDPKYRFPWIFGAVSPKYAASEIISAIQRNYTECIIPNWLFPMNYVLSVLPVSSADLIIDFLAGKTT